MRIITSLCILIIILINSADCQTSGQSIEAPDISPAPWSHLNTNTSSEQFQFAIVADRTGGMRNGIFEKAIKILNLLQPEFVVSVGDLIDGYMEDASLLKAQWQEFDNLISKLDMPFFYVPGNHDISNKKMAEIWKTHHGPAYYHFKYKGVLFLCLNAEDGEQARISENQVTYFKSVLQKNNETRWIMIFMHHPLWDYDDKAGYEKIENLLKGKKYTLFSGHHHHYLLDEKDGNKHFVLGTSGGGSPLRGPELGELDHLVWVTMKEKGPVVANITLEGILDEKIVTRENYPMVEVLRGGSWFSIDPVVSSTKAFTHLQTNIRLKNSSGNPMYINGLFKEQQGLNFEPAKISTQIDAYSEELIPLIINAEPKAVKIPELKKINFELTAGFDKQLIQSNTKELTMDWIHNCPLGKEKFSIDGDLSDWQHIPFLEVKQPQYVKEDWDWKGTSDSWFRFAVTCDDDFLYLALQSIDDKSLDFPEDHEKQQDQFLIHLNPGYNEMEPDEYITNLRQSFTITNGIKLSEKFKEVQVKITDYGLQAECVIPLNDSFYNASRKPGFRLNIGYMDHDNRQNTKPSVLWWRPPWDHFLNYANSGVFVARRGWVK